MDKDVLRRLGWSSELIETMVEATRPSEPPSEAFTPFSSLDVHEPVVGGTMLDLSAAPVIGSSALPPPRGRRK